MSDLSNVIANGFINTYRDFGKKVHDLSEELSEQEFWTKPYPYGNSVGHLALHIIGNLNYYIGARIAQTGYARDRDREFNESDPPPKKEVLRQLDEVVELAVKTLEAQISDSWGTEYSAVGWEALNDRFTAFHRCAAHFQYHTGHMIYLVYEHRRLVCLRLAGAFAKFQTAPLHRRHTNDVRCNDGLDHACPVLSSAPGGNANEKRDSQTTARP